MNHSKTIDRLRVAAKAAEDKKGENIVALDVRGQSSLTDGFLFVSGTSHIHIRAIEDAIREALKGTGALLARTDGQRGHLWRALDYGSFIIHVMDKKTRDFYSMERLWERARPIMITTSPVKQPKPEGQQKKRRKATPRPRAKKTGKRKK